MTEPTAANITRKDSEPPPEPDDMRSISVISEKMIMNIIAHRINMSVKESSNLLCFVDRSFITDHASVLMKPFLRIGISIPPAVLPRVITIRYPNALTLHASARVK